MRPSSPWPTFRALRSISRSSRRRRRCRPRRPACRHRGERGRRRDPRPAVCGRGQCRRRRRGQDRRDRVELEQPDDRGRQRLVLGPTFDNTARWADGLCQRAAASAACWWWSPATPRPRPLAATRSSSRAGDNGVKVVGSAGFAMSQQGVTEAVPGISRPPSRPGAGAVPDPNTDTALPILSQLLPENGAAAVRRSSISA